MPSSLPLEGLYLRMVEAGVPLSIRDYQDALTALRSGDGLHCREELRWLCETLWARTDQEMMLLARVFRDLPRPTLEQIDALTGTSIRSDVQQRSQAPKMPGMRAASASPTEQRAPAIEFGAPQMTGIGLPRAHVTTGGHDPFILTPRPLITLRALIIAWRRFRLSQRSGPPVELDVDRTVAEQCRRGSLVEPVLIPARRNQARVVVLMDASPSMVVWQETTRLVAESLAASQLGQAAAYYFDNAPEPIHRNGSDGGDTFGLFEGVSLTRPVMLDTLIERHPASALLIVSDAGAVRGKRNGERAGQIRGFLDATKSAWPRVVWLNPMGPDRWRGSTAELVTRVVTMFELTEDGLIAAVDYLRGKSGAGGVPSV